MSITLAEQLFGSPKAMGLCVLLLLAGLLFGAAWRDLVTRRIPNALVGSGMALALALHLVLPAGDGFVSVLPGSLGGMAALFGLACGLVAMLPFHIWFGVGAGDVKLIAMLGAFVGPQQIWPLLIAIALAGGGLAIGSLLGGFVGRLLPRGNSAAITTLPEASRLRLPYAVAIALGSLGYLLTQAYRVGFF